MAAVATPPGQGGVGIVRISGPLALKIGESIVGEPLPPRHALHAQFTHEGELLDDGVGLHFAAPNSFTGEDVVELQGHGGPVVMQMLLNAVLAAGARLARPGEFSERAFLNGQIDLAQAEAVADLIASASTQAARGAVRSLSGEFSSLVNELDADILKLRVHVEAAIDFPDEEVELLAQGRVGEQVETLINAVQSLIQHSRQGALLSQGISVAIIGAPNVGKSSLLNRLSGEQAAIVT
ncbi:MAG: 50S ribosome-binding GTPase, partial [Gammaproteobacteria bacterium]|nr:50S ribosome-binding GTPase [Gammaproteobacteria bacterium]